MTSAGRPTIVACANLAWNLVNFRLGLLRALRDEGFDIVAVAPPDPIMQEHLKSNGFRFIAAPIDAMGLSPLRDMQSFLALRRIVRETRPAAWLSWTIKPNVYGSLAAGMCGVPAFPNVSGLGTVFIRRNFLTSLVKRLYRMAFARAPVVFFQNSEDRALFVAAGLARADQARLLPGSGIDPQHFSPAAAPDDSPRRFLLMGRLLGDKGVREYVTAIRVIRHEFPAAEFRLMGSIDAANRTAIGIDEVNGWIAEGLIEILPACDDVRPALAQADWVVLPSYREGLSRVLLEAGAMGRPAITTDVPGCRDVVEDGVNGFLVAPRDAASLAEAMRRALSTDRGEWTRMAAAAREKIANGFSQERVFALYLDALRCAGVIETR